MSEDKNLNGGFEYPDTNGMGTKAKRIANIYSDILSLGNRLPKQISEEDYIKARNAVKAMWDAMNNSHIAKATHSGVHFTKNGDFPKEGSFISIYYTSRLSSSGELRGTIYDDDDLNYYRPATSSVNMLGGPRAPKEVYVYAYDAKAKGISKGSHKFVYFVIWHNSAAHLFKYYTDIDVLREEPTISAKDILRWAYVDKGELTKWIPDYILDDAFENLD